MIEGNVALIGWQELIEFFMKVNGNLVTHGDMIADMWLEYGVFQF